MAHSENRKPGRPPGIARDGKYGSGVRTKVVRIPVHLADNIDTILDTLDTVKAFVHAWDEEIKSSPTSPRYERAKIMLEELKEILNT